MPVKSAPYYWIECDNCGERCDYGDYAAWGEIDQAVAATDAYDWTNDGDRWHCVKCPVLPEGETDG